MGGVITASEDLGTVLRHGEAADWLYIDGLRKKEGNALGFIPRNYYLSILKNEISRNRAYYEYTDLYVTEDNADLTGYCLVTYSGTMAKIFQIVVQEDARRWYRASLMVDEVEDKAARLQKIGVTCRVAYDLESNFFWRAMGYEPVKQVISTWLNQRESKSKRPLWVYEKVIGPLLKEVS